MKNYLDLQAINLTVDFSISISPYSTPIGAKIILNDKVIFNKLLEKQFAYNESLPLLAPITLVIEMYGKDDSKDNKSAIIIDSVKFDEFDVIPRYTGHATYSNNRNFNGPTYHLGFNGSWSLNINEPFYRWHHRVTGQGWLLEPVR